MALTAVLQMMGGIGLFLYGMRFMGQSLSRFAGARMEQTLEKLTSNKVKGVALGAGVTAVIQSSAATILMVIGFLNAGIMQLAGAVPVIMGANIGTTITAQILRLGDIGDDSLLSLIKPATFAPVLCFIAAFVMMFSKKNKTKDKAGIAMGLGVLFVGMSMMEGSFSPLADSPAFIKAFSALNNPLLGVLAGMALTLLLQSSSASVGVLQALTATGAVSFGMMVPMVIGANVGKCGTVLLGSIGANKNARRAAVVDVLMCVSGAIVFLAAIFIYQNTAGFSGWEDTMNRGSVANFHTAFNIAIAVVMLPLSNVLISAAKILVKDDESASRIDEEMALLDERFIANPSIALEQCKKVVLSMGQTVLENFAMAESLIRRYDQTAIAKMRENERFLDKSETVMGEYLIKITGQHLNDVENRTASEMMHTVSDFERIGDHCDNLCDTIVYNNEENIKYSETAVRELEQTFHAVRDILSMTYEAYDGESEELCHEIWPLEDTIDDLVDGLKTKHIDRLKRGECTTQSGISFVEMLTNMERISDHCNNIAVHLHQRITGDSMDKHHKEIFRRETEEYREMTEEYEHKYLDSLE